MGFIQKKKKRHKLSKEFIALDEGLHIQKRKARQLLNKGLSKLSNELNKHYKELDLLNHCVRLGVRLIQKA